MSTTLQLPRFAGWLKQIRPEYLNDEERVLLDIAFPDFAPLSELTEQMRQDVSAHLQHGAEFVYPVLTQPRRFAGDEGLSRGRYYTIAADSRGNDNYCLANELRAYRRVDKSGPVYVFDPACDGDRRLLQQLLPITPREHHIYVVIKDLAALPNVPRVSHFKIKNEEGTMGIFFLPYVVEYTEIEGCVDLRVPKVRNWFFETFKNGDGDKFLKPMARKLNCFLEMLPTLMNPEIGGGPITTIGFTVFGIGNWMRARQIPALVYPSARSDAAVKIQSGEMVQFKGWNLVDYRGAELPMGGHKSTVVDFSDWHRGFPAGVAISMPPPELKNLNDSFQVTGIEEFFDKHYTAAIKKRDVR